MADSPPTFARRLLRDPRAQVGLATLLAVSLVALLAIAPGAAAVPSLAGGFVLLGTGVGVASVASTARGTAALDDADQGLASGLLTSRAQIGTALGLAVVSGGGYLGGHLVSARKASTHHPAFD